MVIIAVLGLLGILLFVVLNTGADIMFASNFLQTLQEKEQAYYIARSALGSTIRYLNLDDAEVDSFEDYWAKDLPTVTLKEGKIKLSIEDEERRFNVNSILNPQGEVDDRALTQFKTLLTLIEANPDFANAVLDWMDRDDETRIPMGAEQPDYKDPPCKNFSLDSLDELLMIKYCQKEDYSGKTLQGKWVPGLKDLLTLHSSGKININTAGPYVIRSLDSSLTEDMVAELIRKRGEKAVSNLDELANLPGFNYDIIYRIKYLADVKSTFFKIRAEAEVGQTKLTLIGILKRGDNQFLTWKVE